MVGLVGVSVHDAGTNSGNAFATTGGLAGISSGTISGSYATGSVTSDDVVGGLVGANLGLGTIRDSYATGSVSGGNRAGGLVGRNDNGIIRNSYATGSVRGTGTNSDAGGLVGRNDGVIRDSYATGSVSGGTDANSDAGGLVGLNSFGIISATPTGIQRPLVSWQALVALVRIHCNWLRRHLQLVAYTNHGPLSLPRYPESYCGTLGIIGSILACGCRYLQLTVRWVQAHLCARTVPRTRTRLRASPRAHRRLPKGLMRPSR